MRVALITDGIWPYVLGGMQKHSYYLCKYLARQKVYVDLFHFNQSEYKIEALEFFSAEELEYIRPTVIDFPKSWPFPGHYLYNSYRYSERVFETIRPRLSTYDFIYTKGFTGWRLLDEKQRHPKVCAAIGIKFHGYEMFQKPPDFKVRLQQVFLLRRPARSLSNKADLVFSYGGKITDIIRSIGVPDSRIFELPSGVESGQVAEAIVPTGRRIRFLFLGRYERRKGIEELTIAMKAILETGRYDAEFQFIGPIPPDKRVAHDRVTYHGEIRSREGLQRLIKQCDVLVCPSWSEGMPNVILEAMAAGLSVVATDVGATRVLVTASTGWLLKAADPEEIRETLTTILTMKPEDVDRKKQSALALIKDQFVWEKLVLALYRKLEDLTVRIQN